MPYTNTNTRNLLDALFNFVPRSKSPPRETFALQPIHSSIRIPQTQPNPSDSDSFRLPELVSAPYIRKKALGLICAYLEFYSNPAHINPKFGQLSGLGYAKAKIVLKRQLNAINQRQVPADSHASGGKQPALQKTRAEGFLRTWGAKQDDGGK
ncbi:hypothetical protein K438DRAFT_1770986 [Mycena galopus ATCC 62051]|nr:hypothetical protein K438DRAFT_1770986 [Mycena galopus ATCC 62051]